jgi:hypothetical protein
MRRASLCATLIALALAAPALAGDPAPQNVFLDDRSASASIALSGPGAGMNGLSPDGEVSRLRLQGFWFRTASMENEANIGQLQLTGLAVTDTNPGTDNRPDTLALQYTGPGFTIEPTWKLRGSNHGGQASVVELIQINNTSRTAPLVISFFQYSHFLLSFGAAPSDVSQIQGTVNNTATQSGNVGFLSETVVTPSPSRWSAGDANALLNQLNDGSITTLDNSTLFGPGNAAWAYQWDFIIPAGGSVLISKTKQLVPTPGAAALLGLGGLVLVRRRR